MHPEVMAAFIAAVVALIGVVLMYLQSRRQNAARFIEAICKSLEKMLAMLRGGTVPTQDGNRFHALLARARAILNPYFRAEERDKIVRELKDIASWFIEMDGHLRAGTLTENTEKIDRVLRLIGRLEGEALFLAYGPAQGDPEMGDLSENNGFDQKSLPDSAQSYRDWNTGLRSQPEGGN